MLLVLSLTFRFSFVSLFAYGRISLGLSTAMTVPGFIFEAGSVTSPKPKKFVALYPSEL